MKTICLIFSFMIVFTNVNAQSENKDVTITSSGSGITLEEAKQSALRSGDRAGIWSFYFYQDRDIK